MNRKSELQLLEKSFKEKKWKKVANFFYQDINDVTMAHFNVFEKGELLRMQAGVSNRVLNRISWDLYGLPKDFGTPKEQLTNSSKCMLSIANRAAEFGKALNIDEIDDEITSACEENARNYSSVEEIHSKLKSLPECEQQHHAGECLCVALALDDRASALHLINQARSEHPGFELSIFAHAERLLAERQ